MLQRMSDGMAAFVMDRGDYTYPMARAAARELLATCVLKQIVCLFTPYNLNKVRPVLSSRSEHACCHDRWQGDRVSHGKGYPVGPMWSSMCGGWHPPE